MAASTRTGALLRLPAALSAASAPPSSVLVALLLPRVYASDPAAGSKLAESACHSVVASILGQASEKAASHPLASLEIMPVVMGPAFGSDLSSEAGAEAQGGSSPASAPPVPLGVVEMAFSGARSGAAESPLPGQRVAVTMLLPQAAAARDPAAAAAAIGAAVAAHPLVVLAPPVGSMPLPPSVEDVASALGASHGPAGAALAAALAARAAAGDATAFAETADEGGSLPPLSLDAMPASLIGSQRHVVIGGTFDRLHAGHWKLVSAAASLAGEELTIGVTSDAMVAGKAQASLIAPQAERAEAVRRAAERSAPGLRVRCVVIDDPAGPSGTDGSMDAIVVSSETAGAVAAINDKRSRAGLGRLRPFVVRRLDASGLSSTELRRG